MESNYFPRIEMRKVITFCIFDAGSKTEFTNDSLKTPKIGKLNIDTLITPQGLLIHEKNPDQNISCYCPFKRKTYLANMNTYLLYRCMSKCIFTLLAQLLILDVDKVVHGN